MSKRSNAIVVLLLLRRIYFSLLIDIFNLIKINNYITMQNPTLPDFIFWNKWSIDLLNICGAVHKLRLSLLMGEGGSAKRWCNFISLFSKMGDRGEGEVKNLKKWVMYVPRTHTKKKFIHLFSISEIELIESAALLYFSPNSQTTITSSRCLFL